jgi:hypothetical protein
MANIVLVTDHCYLQCQAINFIAINEVESKAEEPSLFVTSRQKRSRKNKFNRGSKKKQAKPERLYQVVIDFIPIGNPNTGGSLSRGNDQAQVGVTVVGRDTCLKLFATIVHQIREQQPDALYLNQLVERFLTEQGVK